MKKGMVSPGNGYVMKARSVLRNPALVYNGLVTICPERRLSSAWPKEIPFQLDGAILVPSVQGDYVEWLQWLYERCSAILKQHDFVVANYLEGMSAEHLQLRENACLATDGEYFFAYLQLGRWYLNTKTQEALAEMARTGEQPLEPGVALIALTLMAMNGKLTKPMRVDCPGLMHSPDANGKFNDVTRWDVTPPDYEENTQGLVGLDWNWDRRQRHLQGAASGVIVTP